jgi:DNA-directed RNA polymerase
MDASMMLETVKRLNEEEGITCFATVHDSYAVHARYAGKLARTLREVFIEHYDKGNPLVKFQSEVNEQVKLHIYREGLKVGKSMETLGQEVEEFEDCLPSIPEEGTLDVRKVSDSQYFFA